MTETKLSPQALYQAHLKSLSPEDRQAVADGFTYRVDHPGGRIAYARSLQQASDMTQDRAAHSPPKVTALPWKHKPKATT